VEEGWAVVVRGERERFLLLFKKDLGGWWSGSSDRVPV
jgi:hypothetical protein